MYLPHPLCMCLHLPNAVPRQMSGDGDAFVSPAPSVYLPALTKCNTSTNVRRWRRICISRTLCVCACTYQMQYLDKCPVMATHLYLPHPLCMCLHLPNAIPRQMSGDGDAFVSPAPSVYVPAFTKCNTSTNVRRWRRICISRTLCVCACTYQMQYLDKCPVMATHLYLPHPSVYMSALTKCNTSTNVR